MSTTKLTFRKRPTVGRGLFLALVVAMYLFLLAPLLIVVVISLSSNQFISFPPEGFTFHWYAELANQPRFGEGLKNSLITAGVCTVIVALIGVPASLAIQRGSFRGRGMVEAFLLSPLLVPVIVTALGLTLLLGPLGLTNTYFSIILGHIGVTLPYLMRTTLVALQTSDTSCEEAARVLGAPSMVVFGRVTLPIIAPGVIAGAVLAFIVSFDEVVVSLFVAQSGRPTLPVHIMQYVENSADGTVAALSVVLIAFSVLVVVVVERLTGLRNALN